MMIKRLNIQNFRCLQNIDIELKPFNVLVGPNDSGKSSFLNILEIISTISSQPPADAFHGYFLEHVWKQNQNNKIAVTMQLDNQMEYHISLGAKGHDANLHQLILGVFDEWAKNGGSKILHKMEITETSSLYNSPRQNPQTIVLKQFLRNIQKFSFAADKIRMPSRPRKLETGIGSDGAGLSSWIAALKLNDDETYIQLVKSLQSAIPRIKAINVTHNPENTYEISFTNKDTSIKVPASACSDGVLIFLAYLCLLHSPYPPSVALIEEPENGVHPRRLKTIVSYLKKLSTTTVQGNTPQIVLTTHSPYLLDYVEPEEVLIFCRSKETGATKITRMSEIPDFKKKSEGFLTGEFWTAFGDEMLSGEQEYDD